MKKYLGGGALLAIIATCVMVGNSEGQSGGGFPSNPQVLSIKASGASSAINCPLPAPGVVCGNSTSASAWGSVIGSTAGASALGLEVQAGTGAATAHVMRLQNAAGTSTLLDVLGNGDTTITSAANGAGASVLTVQGGTTAGDRGLLVNGGTNSSDFALIVRPASGASNFLLVNGDGGVQTGTPTGGNEGPGTLNVAGGYFFNGVPLGSATASATGTISAGCTTTPAITAKFRQVGKVVTVSVPNVTCTSNSVSTITVALTNPVPPTTTNTVLGPCENASVTATCIYTFLSAGTGFTVVIVPQNSYTGTVGTGAVGITADVSYVLDP